jgi:hypothetical protein
MLSEVCIFKFIMKYYFVHVYKIENNYLYIYK